MVVQDEVGGVWDRVRSEGRVTGIAAVMGLSSPFFLCFCAHFALRNVRGLHTRASLRCLSFCSAARCVLIQRCLACVDVPAVSCELGSSWIET